ncbi:electron transfer flavoprotein subunit alpha/FixB family protein [Desulfobacterium sp. N47]|uniref:Electron transfer flavoprotein alpha/beta-subunit N-terminal domain-containing protein n=2 Tax=Bacteria TaxID=2 RepID=E1YFR3_9BACT
MKTLIVEVIDPAKLAELVTVSKKFCGQPDVVGIGKGEIPGSYGKAYQTEETIGANLLPALAELVKKCGYEVILFSATTTGSSLAGPLAARLQAAIISEVIAVDSDTEVSCPIYGGKVVAKYKLNAKPAILTIRRKYFEKAELEGATPSEALEKVQTLVSLLAEHEDKAEGVPLEDADIIVSGGRGIGSKDSFAMLQDLATLFKEGAVGASRGAVDDGWAQPSMQIGQTGKIVAPSIYLAIGLSGASQHLAGIANAKCVVAINKDEEANIFNRARFGIVMDYKKVVPALIEALKEEA